MTARHWTHTSVLRLGSDDPVREIAFRARAVVERALDAGWSGPPFDPIALAAHLRIDVTPSDDVRDARTVTRGGRGGFRIEFNPTRPAARARFSIAHEIAHTLFPDCGDFVRNRAAYHELSADGWQLEALCNLAAGEFLMPAGTLPEEILEDMGTEKLIFWREHFDVSMEALLLRLTRLATTPCAAFCASAPATNRDATPRPLHLDYAVRSGTWTVRVPQGMRLPATSIVGECDAVGFTAERDEAWPPFGEVRVDCIGVPPYPGAVRPRVVGLIRPVSDAATATPSFLRTVRGDATRPRGSGAKIIVHVVNDATPNWGGRGFASALRQRFPAAQSAFRDWAVDAREHLSLGMTHLADVVPGVAVASLIAQKGYGESVRPRLRYSALSECLRQVAEKALAGQATVHMPRIGAGQARGSWDLIEGLVREHLCSRGIEVTVYDLPGAKAPIAEQASMAL
jgi:hypothetical protein